jgi:glutaredoxin
MPCEQVKAWLSREGVPFTSRNIDEDDQAYDELVALGFRTIPVTVIGEHRVKGYNEALLAAAVRAAGAG